MKIGHYSPSAILPGGIQSYLGRVILRQRASGHEVTLFSRSSVLAFAGANFFGTDVVPTLNDADLLEQAKARSLDVIHAHTLIKVPAGITPSALVRTMHGHEAYCPSGKRYLARPLARPCPRRYHLLGCAWGHAINRCGSMRPKKFLNDFRRVEMERRSSSAFHTIAISDFVKEQMARSGCSASRIRVILNPAPDPLPTATVPAREEAHRFFALGRLVPEKGFDWLLRSVARLSFPFQLSIAGVGPAESILRKLASRLRITDKVTFLGWIDLGDVFAQFARASAVIVPSLWHEPAGLVALEAAAARRAVIASKVGGIPQYARHLQNAILVEPNDIDGLARALTQLYKNPRLSDELGTKGWMNLCDGRLGIAQHVAELDRYYEEVITSNARREMVRGVG